MQLRKYAVQHSESPFAIIKQIGAQHVSAIKVARIVRCDAVEGNQRSTTAAFERRGVTAFIRYEVLERRQENASAPFPVALN